LSLVNGKTAIDKSTATKGEDRMKPLTLALLLFGTPSFAQSVAQVSGGASNYIGNGGSVVLYGPNGETHFSAGVINGHFTYNAAENFMLREWEVGVGDDQFAITSGQMSLNAPVRGISLTRKRPYACHDDVRTPATAGRVGLVGYVGQRCRGDELRVFAGAVGQAFSSPFFFGIQKTHVGAGFGYKRELTRHLTVGTIQAVAARRTSLEEADYKRGHFEIHGQGGWLENNLQLNGSASASWLHFGAVAGRSTYIFSKQLVQIGPVLPDRVTVNNFGVYGGYSRFSGSASRFQSNLNTGKSFSVGTRFGFLQVQASNYISGKASSKLLTFTEHSLHWSLSQYITRSSGTTNFNFGVGYSSNRLNFQAGYSVLYFPALSQPFQKVLSITVGFRLRGVSINTGTIVQPNGRNQWVVGGDDYLQTRMRVPSMPGATSHDMRWLPSTGHGGKYTVEGTVVDDKGAPVEGAGIVVGNDTVFTDSCGHFSIREKHKDSSIVVNSDNFMTGEWDVVSAPPSAHTGEPAKIVVRRK
jgi:hypothetical protein